MSQRIEQLTGFLREEPDDPFLHYSLALEYLAREPEEANRLLTELLARFPDYLPAYYQAGLLKIQRAETPQAKAILERGISLAKLQLNIKAANELRHLLEGIEDE